jgi:hypothetical protein
MAARLFPKAWRLSPPASAENPGIEARPPERASRRRIRPAGTAGFIMRFGDIGRGSGAL